MKFGKKSIGAITAGLSLVMALSPVAAFAEGETTVPTTTTPQVTKHLVLNDGSTVDATFSFTAEAAQLTVQGEGTTAEKTAPVAEVPAITIDNIAFTAATETAGENTKTTAIKLADGASFPHAGIYAWRVHETTGNQTGVQYNTGNNAYTLIANVVNGDNGLTATYVMVKNDTTNSVTNQDKAGDEGAEFTNKYTESANGEGTDLTITKKVAGNQGDKTKPFSFTVTFTAPEVLPAGIADAAAYYDQLACDVQGATHNGATFTFTLKDGESAYFSNVIAGTKYAVTETAVNGYTQSYAAVNNGVNATTTSGNLIGENANTGTMTNTHADVTPTGIVINNAPYIVMAGAAVAGVVAYGAAKRKLEK